MSEDERSIWYLHPSGLKTVSTVYENQNFLSGQPIAVAATKGNTLVKFYPNISSSAPTQSIEIEYDGQTKSMICQEAYSVISVSNADEESSIVSILKQKSEAPTSPYLTVINETTNTLSFSGGSAYALVIGGGGGGGGTQALVFFNGGMNFGGGGGTGGVGVYYISDLTNVTSATIGSGGNGGSADYNSVPSAGGSGGSTSISNFTVNGGSGGSYTSGNIAAGGSPGGASGAPALFSSSDKNVLEGSVTQSLNHPYAATGSTIVSGSRWAGNANGSNLNFYQNYSGTKTVFGGIGYPAGKNTPAFGKGYGGNGASFMRSSPNGGFFIGSSAGGKGQIILMRSEE